MNYKDYMKERKANELNRFFGEVNHTSNKYFQFKRLQDDENIIIVTKNVIANARTNTLLLVVANNKAIYLKEWQVKKVRNYDNGVYGFAVKLNKNFMKAYTFQKDFDNFYIEKENTFTELVAVAKIQENENMTFALDGNIWE